MSASASVLLPRQVEAIEQATLHALAPRAVEAKTDDAGNAWLLPFDPGNVGRAHSAVPLCHAQGPRDPQAWIEQVQARYAVHGLPARWRLADVPAFDGLRQALQALAYRNAKPTLTQTASVQKVRDALGPPAEPRIEVNVASAPDAAWLQLFLGPGVDPFDAQGRLLSLGRGQGNRFVRARLDGRTVAVARLSLATEWASVHGLRTEPAMRGRGLAGCILHALADEALRQGARHIFLQVEEGNAPALALYHRAGFRDVWRYRYWTRPD